jgi:dihydroneopterin aldolase
VNDQLRVHDVEVDCVIGVYAEERTTTQPLRISLTLTLDVARAARSGRLDDTVDYARLFGQLRFVLQHGAFRLIETAAEALCAVTLRAAPAVDDVTLTLAKPRALGGNGLPSLTLCRRRTHAPTSADARLWPGPDASIDVITLGAGERAQVTASAAVLDVHDARQGSTVAHDGVVNNDGAAPRTLLVVMPFDVDEPR